MGDDSRDDSAELLALAALGALPGPGLAGAGFGVLKLQCGAIPAQLPTSGQVHLARPPLGSYTWD